MNQPNFIIGRGELLTSDVTIQRGMQPPQPIYSFAKAIEKLSPQIVKTGAAIRQLPAAACPSDYAVAKLTLHPAYIAKSYYPASLLRAAELISVGSRNVTITPEKWRKKGDPTPSRTNQLLVAGKRRVFAELAERVRRLTPDGQEALELAQFEVVDSFTPEEKIKHDGARRNRHYEVALHRLPDSTSPFVQDSFTKYVADLGGETRRDLEFYAGNLWFVPVEIDSDQIEKIAQFSFVRVVRPMPALRSFRPSFTRAGGATLSIALPTEQALSSEPKVAILDGGLPQQHVIGPWLNRYEEMDEQATLLTGGDQHGLAVSSAFLFGPLRPGEPAPRPYANISHFRVLDNISGTDDPFELYRALQHVEDILLSGSYNFVNLSLGPDLPISDDEVHAWTSVIDLLLSNGETLMTIAAGNNGEKDQESGNARVQVPGDCVNAIAVGACDKPGKVDWQRAAYSAIGPGRSPGVIKPDLVAFGGSPDHYFHVLTPGSRPIANPTMGTSFAAPYLLRTAVGIRAVMGGDLKPLTLKALMVHCADSMELNRREVGWGKTAEELTEIIMCGDGVARVVYQGILKPGKYLRALVPVPTGGIQGNVTLSATFCYACPTDPEDSGSYTRAGLEVTFRPNLKVVKEGKKQSATRSFFERKTYADENERRNDYGKWETVLHASDNFRGSTLVAPGFDIHYNARENGGGAGDAGNVKYALIISLHADKHPSIYADILRAYPNILAPITPQVSLPIRV